MLQCLLASVKFAVTYMGLWYKVDILNKETLCVYNEVDKRTKTILGLKKH